MASFYDHLLAQTAGPPPPPAPRPPVCGTAPATPQAQARRQLESRERGLLRELRAIELELRTVRAQLAS